MPGSFVTKAAGGEPLAWYLFSGILQNCGVAIADGLGCLLSAAHLRDQMDMDHYMRTLLKNTGSLSESRRSGISTWTSLFGFKSGLTFCICQVLVLMRG